MLVMSAYGQIEQFGSKALSGGSSGNTNAQYLQSLEKNTSSVNLRDTLSFTKVSSFIRPKTESEEAEIVMLKSSVYDKNIILSNLEILHKNETNKNVKDSIQVVINIEKRERQHLIDLLEQAIQLQQFKADRDSNYNHYIKTYKLLLTERLEKAVEKMDTIVPRISRSSTFLDSIKVENMAILKNDDHFDKDTFAKKLFQFKWKIGKTIETNNQAKKKLLLLQHDLTKKCTSKELDTIESKLNIIVKDINASYKLEEELNSFAKTYNIQRNKIKNDQFQLGAQPDILTNFAGSNVLNVVPNIDIIGSYYYDDGANGVSANVRLFSGYSNTDSSIHRNASSFWLPEASLFGISFDVLAAFVPAVKDQKNIGTKRIGFRFAPSFLIKNTPERNTNGEFTGTGNGVGVIHVRTGLEYYPIRFLILYANFNCVTPITQVQTFRNFYGTSKSLYPFFDFGFRTPIIISNKENKNTTINIDVNFIGISGDMKAVYPTNDVIIPSIRLGIVQRFNTGD